MNKELWTVEAFCSTELIVLLQFCQLTESGECPLGPQLMERLPTLAVVYTSDTVKDIMMFRCMSVWCTVSSEGRSSFLSAGMDVDRPSQRVLTKVSTESV
jgi:hypothetical protein